MNTHVPTPPPALASVLTTDAPHWLVLALLGLVLAAYTMCGLLNALGGTGRARRTRRTPRRRPARPAHRTPTRQLDRPHAEVTS